MNKLKILFLLLLAQSASAQEATPVAEAVPFWKDKTFLMLAGGALILIIVLIVKKIMDRRGEEEYEDSNS
ncbi:hypothetical protein KKH39_03840 [Patescibacteria group bacterium]|nr:hypothetical protein [Patescibacteria group bacterium]